MIIDESSTEYVYFRKKLGIQFKIFDGKVIITGLDSGKSNEQEEPVIADVSEQPEKTEKIDNAETNSDTDSLVLDSSKIDTVVEEVTSPPLPESQPPPLPVTLPPPLPVLAKPPPPPPRSPAKTTTKVENLKIVVESQQFFGENVKKILKFTSEDDTKGHLNFLKRSLVTSCELPITISDIDGMTLFYYDADVEDYVVLDVNSWEELVDQIKKMIRVTYKPIPPPPPLAMKSTSFAITEDNDRTIITSPNKTEYNDKSDQKQSPRTNNEPPPIPVIKLKDDLPKETSIMTPSPKTPQSSGSLCKRPECKLKFTPNLIYKSMLTLLKASINPATMPHINTGSNNSINENGSNNIKHKIWVVTTKEPLIGQIVAYVNGVQVHDLDKDFQLALIKQKRRPLLIEYKMVSEDLLANNNRNLKSTDSTSNLNELSMNASSKQSLAPDALASTPSQPIRIKYAFFFAKYMHGANTKTRNKVDKLLQDYHECDWKLALKENTGMPQHTITSIYKYIESEMNKIEMFNPNRGRGQGCPEVLSEEQWSEIRDHIEIMIFKRVATHTKSLWPIYSGQRALYEDIDEESNSSDLKEDKFIDVDLNVVDANPTTNGNSNSEIITELSNNHSLHMKLAYMRFLTLENLGLTMKSSENNDANSARYKPKNMYKKLNNFSKILSEREEWYLAMKGLCRAMQFETPSEILQRLVSTSKLITHALHAYVNNQQANSVNILCKTCGKLHIRSASSSNDIVIEEETKNSAILCSLSSQATLMSEKIKESTEMQELSADDLMPAMTWVIIQANPSNIEYILWLISEFRHPDLLRGEEAYCVAQLTSAVEFCRRAKLSSFEIAAEEYSYQMIRYNNTLKLLIAIKLDRMTLVIDLVSNKNANINGLSPDFRDTPLTACIKFDRLEILYYLLRRDDVEVDTLVNLYHGTYQRATALLIAAKHSHFHAVVALLSVGANRYHSDDHGNTALSIAQAEDNKPIQVVLEADPEKEELIEAIQTGNDKLVTGLILQGINVNYFSEKDNRISPLHAAIASQKVELVRLFLFCPMITVDLNLKNSKGEHSLLFCIKQFYEQKPTAELVTIAAMLLRAGADRKLADESGKSALDYCKKYLEECKSSVDRITKEQLAAKQQQQQQNDENSSTRKSIILSPYASSLENMDYKGYASVVEVYYEYLKDLKAIVDYDPLNSYIKIYEIAKESDVTGMKALLFLGVNINEFCVNKGYNAIIAAVYNKDLTMMNVIMQSESFDKLTNPTYSSWLSTIPSQSNSNEKMCNIKQMKWNRLDVDLPGRGGMRALHYASQLGENAIVGRLLQYGASRIVLNDKQHTPIDVALANNHIDVSNTLRFDPSQVSICLAAKHGDWMVISALIVQGVSINTKRIHEDTKGYQHELYTPLMAASFYQQTETVKRMLEMKDIELDAQNTIGQTALMFAANNGDEPMVLKFLLCGANRYLKDNQGHDALYYAEQKAFLPLMHLLKNDPNRMYIHDVIRKNDFNGVIAMLKQNVDINQRRKLNDGTNSVKESLAHLIVTDENNSNGNSPRKSSTSSRHDSRSLSNADGSTPIDGETPLMVAARYNRVEVIALLLKAPNIDIDRVDSQGWTALFHSAQTGQDEAALLLIKAGATRTLKNHFGQTAIQVATLANKLSTAALIETDPYKMFIHDLCEQGKLLHAIALLKQGCPPNFRDERKGFMSQTPLMAAASGGQADVLRMLLKHTAVQEGKDDKDALGRTALMRAAAKGHLNCTAVLLNAGCDRNLKDNDNLTASDHASRHSYSTYFKFMSQNMMR